MKSKQIQTRVPLPLVARLEKLAAKRYQTVSELIRRLIIKELNK